jgi:hypothetical protein
MSILKTTIGKVGAAGLVAAVGLGGLLLTAPAANAATQGDRVEGKWVMTNAGANPNREPSNGFTHYSIYSKGGIPYRQATAAMNASSAAETADVFSFPAEGTLGPIVHEASGKCLARTAMTDRSLLALNECNGGADQVWTIGMSAGYPAVLDPTGVGGPGLHNQVYDSPVEFQLVKGY